MSFFMLLVVSLGEIYDALYRFLFTSYAGLSVVRESLGELELESTSALVLLMFVIPLAFTLSGFLLWILYSLNGWSLLSLY